MSRVLVFRKALGWSQGELAAMSGVSRRAIREIETGKQRAWPAMRERLSQVIGVSEKALFSDAVTDERK